MNNYRKDSDLLVSPVWEQHHRTKRWRETWLLCWMDWILWSGKEDKQNDALPIKSLQLLLWRSSCHCFSPCWQKVFGWWIPGPVWPQNWEYRRWHKGWQSPESYIDYMYWLFLQHVVCSCQQSASFLWLGFLPNQVSRQQCSMQSAGRADPCCLTWSSKRFSATTWMTLLHLPAGILPSPCNCITVFLTLSLKRFFSQLSVFLLLLNRLVFPSKIKDLKKKKVYDFVVAN